MVIQLNDVLVLSIEWKERDMIGLGDIANHSQRQQKLILVISHLVARHHNHEARI